MQRINVILNVSSIPNSTHGPGEAISHGDGALELETPEEGATLERASDGGQRAWLIVLACTGINALLSIMQMLILVCLLDDDMSADTGIKSDTLLDMYEQLIALSDMFAPLAAFVMIGLGYQATVSIGAGVVMATVVYLSYRGDEDTEKLTKFILYGPTAVGISFIKLGALIPVLEYFTKKRMRALFLSRLGTYVGQIILVIVVILYNPTVKWRDFLRGSAGPCVGIALLGLTLKELKLQMKDDQSVTFVQKTLGLAKKEILKNALFWLTCAVYFFYQWGIETPQAQFTDPDTADRLKLDGNLTKGLCFGLSPTIGLLLGSFLAWVFKKVASDETSRLHDRTLKAGRFNIIFGILVVAAGTMGIGCFIAPNAVNFGYFTVFSLLFAASFAFCEGLRDDAVPDEFGRENIRIVEGLIIMFAGLGGIVTNEIGGEIDEGETDDWKKLFRYGGGMLLLSSIFTSVVLCLKQNKALGEMNPNINPNSVVPLSENRGNQSQIQQNIDNVRNTKFLRERNGFRPFQQRVVPLTSSDSSGLKPYQQSGVPSTSGLTGVHPYQQTGVQSTSGFTGVQPYQQTGVPSASGLTGVQTYQQTGVQSASGFTGVQSYQQTGVPSTSGFTGIQPYQQTGVPVIIDSAKFHPNQQMELPSNAGRPIQQTGVPFAAGSSGFHPHQQTGVPLTAGSSGFHPNQQTIVPSTAGMSTFHPNHQTGVLLTAGSGFHPHQQMGVPLTADSNVFHHYQQTEVPLTAGRSTFHPNHKTGVPLTVDSGRFHHNQLQEVPTPAGSSKFQPSQRTEVLLTAGSSGLKPNPHQQSGLSATASSSGNYRNQQLGVPTSAGSNEIHPNQQPEVPMFVDSSEIHANQQPGIPMTVGSSEINTNQQPGIPMTVGSSEINTHQQPGVPTTVDGSEVHPNQQPGVPTTADGSEIDIQQQPGVPTTAVGSEVHLNQQPEVQTTAGRSESHPHQQTGVPSTAGIN